jgi:nuclear pore complex protein Nup155
MLSITGTDSGRIFMLGQNRNVYELEYSASSGSWFFGSSNNVKLHNRTSGALTNWTPSMFASKSDEGVQSLTVDAQQNRLYTLSTKNEIEMFDVSGNGWVSKGKRDNKREAIGKVVSLAAIGAQESSAYVSNIDPTCRTHQADRTRRSRVFRI